MQMRGPEMMTPNPGDPRPVRINDGVLGKLSAVARVMKLMGSLAKASGRMHPIVSSMSRL